MDLPKVGLGTGYDFNKNFDKANFVKTLRFGIKLGLNFIDTAENYGSGLAEELVGQAIKGKRDKVIVATKFSPEHSTYQGVINACEASLRRLHTDYIDVYQLHWPNPDVDFKETMDALFVLKEKQKIREIGLGNLNKSQLVRINKFVKSEKIFSLQTEFNLFERYIESNGVSDYCKQNKIQVIAFSPLDQGRVHDLNSKELRILNSLKGKYNFSLSQLMLAWIIFYNYLPIPRTSNIGHLKEFKDATIKQIEEKDFKALGEIFSIPVKLIKPSMILVDKMGERNMLSYDNLRPAIENKLMLTPSPVQLSKEIKKGLFLKPIRLVKLKKNVGKFEYKLIGGRVRFWAWVIAFGYNKPVPAFVRDDLTK